jgi:hypothetical protein
MNRRTLVVAVAVALAACGGGDATAPEAVANISITPPPGALVVGQTTRLTATVMGTSGNPLTDRTITWQSGDQTIATVATGGLVTVVGEGSVNISATAGGITGTTTLTTKFPYPRVSGTYGFQAFFDGVPGIVAQGIVTFTQASRLQPALASSSTLTYSIAGSNGVLNQVTKAVVDSTGHITFEVGSNNTTTSWKFDGAVTGLSITGRHVLTSLGAGTSNAGTFQMQRNAPFVTLVAPNAPVWGPDDLLAALRSVRK